MPGLCDLPDEVVLLTLNCDVCGPADLAAVALSCKRLKEVAEDALYAQNRDRDWCSSVDWAARHGSISTLDKALEHGLSIMPIEQSPFEPGINPLQTAVGYGQESAVNWFLDHGADINEMIYPSCSCLIGDTGMLHPAICSRNTSMALLLISRGATLDYWSYRRGHSDYHATALLEASLFGLDTVVEVLVKGHGLSLQIPKALAWAAVQDCNMSTIKTLVGLAGDINWSHTEWDQSPLHSALSEGSFAIANVMLDLGANIHPHGYHLNTEDQEYGEDDNESDYMDLQTPQASFSPLHDTLVSRRQWDGFSSIFETYKPNLGKRELSENWKSEKSRLVKRLIQLGTDVNMEVLCSRGDGPGQLRSPLDLAIECEDIENMETLLAAGAKVNSKTLLITAWETYPCDLDKKECMEVIKTLLKHGARLDEPIQHGLSILQMLAADESHADREWPGLHEILPLASPSNLSHEHLTKVLVACLTDLDWYTSAVLIRHGAHVSSEDELYHIANLIAEKLEFGSEYYTADCERGSMFPESESIDCMRIILDLGLSGEDQCYIFFEMLRKKQIALAHFFLDRGIGNRPETAKYMPAYLALAASWGNVGVIQRLWQHAHEAVDATLRNSIVHKSITRGKRDAVSFFMEHGATPFDYVLPAHFVEQFRFGQDTYATLRAMCRRLIGLDRNTGQFSSVLSVVRDFRKEELRLALAVRFGHMDIISDLLQYLPQNADAKMDGEVLPSPTARY
ncbi:hypothetical protein DHEL01_v211041 [Diaporthe helianthi]|uniref:Uncharacterized protein n=1 Tax=Diaporthe helianthi TaxID=158607 RepID=A0A2P5HJX9_DIAHE|nr:hypothetical protein DHEL01_v211041 [Diaporthe helianthi]